MNYFEIIRAYSCPMRIYFGFKYKYVGDNYCGVKYFDVKYLCE